MENKDKLPPIPTPASQRWREFRIQVLPVVVFAAAVLGIVYLWKNFVQPVGIVGLAQTNTVNVTCTVDGLISQLLVEPFQTVTQGQVVAIVQAADSDVVQAESEAAIAELAMMRDRIKVGLERSEQGFERYRVDLLLQQIALDEDKARVFYASNEMWRTAQLVKEGTENQSVADLKKADFDALAASIARRTTAIADLEMTVKGMQKNLTTTNDITSVDDAIRAKRREMDELLKPSTLRSAINGIVSFVHHYPGEKIIRGTAIASIASPISTNIIGYIRQPITVLPTTNDTVHIITRTQPRKVLEGRIRHLGAQLEAINPSLISVDASRSEWGLPIQVELPAGAGLTLVPGEFVTLSIGSAPR
jgi:multidrug resistance efflux pump